LVNIDFCSETLKWMHTGETVCLLVLFLKPNEF
jgi:hypothetical protein